MIRVFSYPHSSGTFARIDTHVTLRLQYDEEKESNMYPQFPARDLKALENLSPEVILSLVGAFGLRMSYVKKLKRDRHCTVCNNELKAGNSSVSITRVSYGYHGTTVKSYWVCPDSDACKLRIAVMGLEPYRPAVT
jgi:hypothetical protein